MGVNKALLEYEGARLIDRVLATLRGLFKEIIMVTNTPREYADLDAEIVTDLIPGMGAVGGIYTGLFYASGDYSFVCACDMPFMNQSFISYMVRRSGNYDIIVPRSTGGRQPLHALYSRRCLNRIEKQVREGRFKISDFYEHLRVLEIKPEEIERHSQDIDRIFFNVNTQEDWTKFREDGSADGRQDPE